MSSEISISEQPGNARPRRILACVLCQQRKVKCDRRFPCANCVKGNAQCIPATAPGPGQRRRRFPERELLDRLRHYEELLRKNNIDFEPLHPSPTGSSRLNEVPSSARVVEPEDTRQYEQAAPETDNLSSQGTSIKSEPVNLWRAISKKSLGLEDDDHSDDDSDNDILGENRGLSDTKDYVHRAVIRNAWNRTFGNESTDHLLFGSPATNVDLSTLHPAQAKIFKLWQIYLDNIDPLLKVTHAPTLQARIVDAVGDITSVSPDLEALIFSIYCISILSIDDDECRSLFGLPRNDLLSSYHFGCRQALQNCHFLRTSDRDCLTALFIYLISVRGDTDPRAMSSMLGIAIRTAKRMGIHDESSYTKCTPLEAEMRRRLWWSIVNFDHRISEMFDHQNSSLSPTWNCKTLLNVNDFEFQPEMKASPTAHGSPTHAIFAVVRSELGDCVRHSSYHIDFINPSLKAMVKEETSLEALKERMESKYLALCNPENPLHFMTIWWTRGYIAKSFLMEYYAGHSKTNSSPHNSRDNKLMNCALDMLECDTKLMTSPMSKGYRWLIEFHFPFPAYMYVIQRIKSRPEDSYVDKAWNVMSDNYEARMMNEKRDNSPLLVVFSAMVLEAWDLREAALRQPDKHLEPPRIVIDLKNRQMMTGKTEEQTSGTQIPATNAAFGVDEAFNTTTMGFTTPHNPVYFSSTTTIPWAYPNLAGVVNPGMDLDIFDWNDTSGTQ